jgi:ATPase subunit of ABC transporter with duplicated ATPase domains
MSILQARGLALRYAQEQPLFQAVDFEINPGDRIALVGPNGAGKSSLLRILTGDQPPDRGTITRRRGLVTAAFSQSDPGDPELSAGQRARARLAQILAESADLLLLDEPTNHLDARGRHWLAHQLLRHNRTSLFVSHDEDFLAQLATRVFEIRRGQFREYNGGYAQYQSQAQLLERQSWAAYHHSQRQLAAFERAAQRRDSLAAKVAVRPPDSRDNPFYKAKSAKVARTARLLRERIPQLAQVQKPWEDQPISTLDFLHFTRPADPPIDLQNLILPFTGAHLHLTIRRGERWALRGPNGSGKTTLFRTIRGELPPAAGAVKIGNNVKLGYFAQQAETLDPNESPLDCCLRGNPDRTWVQTILACLKLPRAYASVPIRLLSLGERAKTALAQILTAGANVLLLDEPTNHLEIEARLALRETLAQYPGTILFASHDQAFTEAVATHTLDLARPARDSQPRPQGDQSPARSG